MSESSQVRALQDRIMKIREEALDAEIRNQAALSRLLSGRAYRLAGWLARRWSGFWGKPIPRTGLPHGSVRVHFRWTGDDSKVEVESGPSDDGTYRKADGTLGKEE